jgi:hypothetical protein
METVCRNLCAQNALLNAFSNNYWDFPLLKWSSNSHVRFESGNERDL